MPTVETKGNIPGNFEAKHAKVMPVTETSCHSVRMLRISFAAILTFATPALADAPKVVGATADKTGDSWTISITIAHPDTGWDHYASGWEVLAPDGTRLGYRELAHPHVDEQPFTRSLSGVEVAPGIKQLLIRPRCNLDGWVAEPYAVNLPG